MTPTSPPGRRPVRPSSSTSRSSTTASGGTPRWGTCPRRSTNGKTVNPLSTFRGELQLAQESRIHLCTFDSILRMGASQKVGLKKNVLKHAGSSFAFKSAQADTNIFAWYDHRQIGI